MESKDNENILTLACNSWSKYPHEVSSNAELRIVIGDWKEAICWLLRTSVLECRSFS